MVPISVAFEMQNGRAQEARMLEMKEKTQKVCIY